MTDTQFISELMFVVLEKGIMGFDQDSLDELYAKYEEPTETAPELNPEEFQGRFAEARGYIVQMNEGERIVEEYAKGFGHFYSLWAIVALCSKLPPPAILAERYKGFMEKVSRLAAEQDLDAFLRLDEHGEYTLSFSYLTNSRGASTDLGPRQERFKALSTALLGEEP